MALARDQAAEHRRLFDHYRALHAEIDPDDTVRAQSRSRILELGIAHEQAYVDFWTALAEEPDRVATSGE